MTERAPSKWRLSGSPKRKQREAQVAAAPAQLGGASLSPASASRPLPPIPHPPSRRGAPGPHQPGPHRPDIARGHVHSGVVLFLAQSSYGTPDHPTVSATITAVTGGSALFLLLIAAFYGGELVWRERDRKMNELIDSTAVPSWVMTVPKMLAIFLILLIVNVASALTGIVLCADRGRSRDRPSRTMSCGSSSRPRSTGC